MNITQLNLFSNFQTSKITTNQKTYKSLQMPPKTDTFRGSSQTVNKEFDNSMQYIKSYFEKPLEIETVLSSIFDNPEEKEKYVAVDLTDVGLQNAINLFYSCYGVNKKERAEFCDLAKKILNLNSKGNINTKNPSKVELETEKQLEIQEIRVRIKGYIKDGTQYPVKYVFKYNPYTSLRNALEHNLYLLEKE